MKRQSDCCERYKKKGRACKNCPKMTGLGKKKRRKLLKKFKKK